MSAPTLVQYLTDSGAFNTTGTNHTIPSTNYLAGDLVVVIVFCDIAAVTLGVPTWGLGTFTVLKQNNPGVAGTCTSLLAWSIANSSGASTIATTNSNNTNKWGSVAWQFRNARGIGSVAELHTTTAVVSLPGVTANSAIVWGSADFNAGATGSATPVPTDTQFNAAVGAPNYTVCIADLLNQPQTGGISYGTTASGGPFSLLVCEIIGESFIDVGEPEFAWGGGELY